MVSKNQRQRRRAQWRRAQRRGAQRRWAQRRWAQVNALRKMPGATKQSWVRGTKLVKTSAREEGGKSRAVGKSPAEKKIPVKEKMHRHKGEFQAGATIPPTQRIGPKRKSRPQSQSGAEADELSHKNGEQICQKRNVRTRPDSRSEARELSVRNWNPLLLPVPHQGVGNVVLESSGKDEVPRTQCKRKRKLNKRKNVEGMVIPVAKVRSPVEKKVIPVAKVTTPHEGPRGERKRKNKTKKKKKSEEMKVPPYGRVGWNERPPALAIVRRWISNSGGDPKKVKVDDCRAYLRYHGLRISGTKPVLVDRIKEHIKGSKICDWSTFTINCRGDVCKGDVIRFKHLRSVRSSAKTVVKPRVRTVAGRIVSESYGTKRGQHTFTVEILGSTGHPPLPLMKQLLVKGRKLYKRGVFRQKWEDEVERDKTLDEKHERGAAAKPWMKSINGVREAGNRESSSPLECGTGRGERNEGI